MKTTLCIFAAAALTIGAASVTKTTFLRSGSYVTDRDPVLWTNTPPQELGVYPCGDLEIDATGGSGSRWGILSGLRVDSLTVWHAPAGTVPTDRFVQMNRHQATQITLRYLATNLYISVVTAPSKNAQETWYRVEQRPDRTVILEAASVPLP